MRSVIALVVFIVIVGAAAGAGGLFMPDSWYAGLRKPAFNPPNWIFAPVWTTLYLLMAVAAWLVWRRSGIDGALLLFIVQLVLNSLWTYFFFGRHAPGLALADIVVLWIAIIGTIFLFAQRSGAAAWMLAPYLAWVSFAALLNFEIWRLNAAGRS
ncbi:MAG: TspO/MBR family protein [Acidobacteriota bacterium]